jgi:hypothetical protein
MQVKDYWGDKSRQIATYIPEGDRSLAQGKAQGENGTTQLQPARAQSI